jgi:hypothetical protein
MDDDDAFFQVSSSIVRGSMHHGGVQNTRLHQMKKDQMALSIVTKFQVLPPLRSMVTALKRHKNNNILQRWSTLRDGPSTVVDRRSVLHHRKDLPDCLCLASCVQWD